MAQCFPKRALIKILQKNPQAPRWTHKYRTETTPPCPEGLPVSAWPHSPPGPTLSPAPPQPAPAQPPSPSPAPLRAVGPLGMPSRAVAAPRSSSPRPSPQAAPPAPRCSHSQLWGRRQPLNGGPRPVGGQNSGPGWEGVGRVYTPPASGQVAVVTIKSKVWGQLESGCGWTERVSSYGAASGCWQLMGSPTRSETQSVCSSSHSSPLQNEVLIPQVLQVNSRNKEKMSDSSSLTTAIQTEKQNPEAGESRQVFCEPGNCPCQPAQRHRPLTQVQGTRELPPASQAHKWRCPAGFWNLNLFLLQHVINGNSG